MYDSENEKRKKKQLVKVLPMGQIIFQNLKIEMFFIIKK